MSKIKDLIAFIDAPDSDNFAMLIALIRMNPDANVHVCLTSRPVRLGATKEHQNWEWLIQDSIKAQEVSALRIKNFLRHFNINIIKVYDGGIAPRTLVPHYLHFADYYRFLDADPLQAICHSELEPQEDLVRKMLTMEECVVAVGGPMTGLHQIIMRNPEVVECIKEVHAMFATWGTVEMMQFSDKPRGSLQFNVACDPFAAYTVLMGLKCPTYLMTTEVTRVSDIGFVNALALRNHLPQNVGTQALYNLYALWYDAAVKPRQDKNPNELIFIHDIVSAFSLNELLRNEIYEVVPTLISNVPHLPHEKDGWGKVFMKETNQETNHFVATGLKPNGAEIYLEMLKEIFN